MVIKLNNEMCKLIWNFHYKMITLNVIMSHIYRKHIRPVTPLMLLIVWRSSSCIILYYRKVGGRRKDVASPQRKKKVNLYSESNNIYKTLLEFFFLGLLLNLQLWVLKQEMQLEVRNNRWRQVGRRWRPNRRVMKLCGDPSILVLGFFQG